MLITLTDSSEKWLQLWYLRQRTSTNRADIDERKCRELNKIGETKKNINKEAVNEEKWKI